MKKRLLQILGVSILIGIAIGFFTSEKKYYYMFPGEPKREITYQNYYLYSQDQGSDRLDRNDRRIDPGQSTYISAERVYNTKYAIIFGLTTLGILVMLLSITKKELE